MADSKTNTHLESFEGRLTPNRSLDAQQLELSDEDTEAEKDVAAKSAYYDYSSEKSMSHVEAKMFYHRHRMENTRGDQEMYSPIPRANTFSAFEIPTGLSRSSSTASTVKGFRRGKERSATIGVDNKFQAAENVLSDIPEQVDMVEQSDEDVQGEDEDDEVEVEVPINLANVVPELRTICTNIKNALAIRRKYIKLSLQTWAENPKNQPSWPIYPPPPVPVWDEEKNRPDLSNSVASIGSQGRRKAGHDIGGDFHLDDLLPVPGEAGSTTFQLNAGSVFQVSDISGGNGQPRPIVNVPTLRDYYIDLGKLTDWSADGPSKTFAFKQLDILEGKFNLYAMENAYQETADAKIVPHRDFYNVRKVDTHVHHSSCMNQKHLLRYIKSKMKKAPHEKVMYRDGKHMTLEEVFESIDLKSYDLSIDTLDMHAHTDSFHRFDKFNLKYNPIGESRLREIFLKTDNYIKGKYLAEVTREVISDLESSKYQMVEWRISIYGKSLDEWSKLANWIVDNKLFSHNVRWLIQIPRLYEPFKATGTIQNFEQIVVNIFRPLFEVTQDPQSSPNLHIFLQRVIGFDTVDDESKPERRVFRKFPTAREWNTKQNPPYTHWIYYLFANMTSLNAWRKQRGFNTFLLRPHCGEAGDPDHLACAVLCCHSISHGITLRKVPFFQYLFYLDQIGIAMSPLSNNALFLSYERNPFIKYFRRGLNVSLSTDDPLQLAFTKEPLIEEYSVAAQIYKLSAADMCELAANSVLQSGFEHSLKQHWLGKQYQKEGPEGNEVRKTNIPGIRKAFRYHVLKRERQIINVYAEPDWDEELDNTTSSTMMSPQEDEEKNTDSIDGEAEALKSTPRGSPTKAKTSRSNRSSTLPIPSAALGTLDSASLQLGTGPKIFPGLVQERIRRSSVRQASGSEHDVGGASMSRVDSKGSMRRKGSVGAKEEGER